MPEKINFPSTLPSSTDVAVIWIDWYPYHVARFVGLQSAAALSGRVTGIELVGGVGVHAGLKFREELPDALPVITLMPESDWQHAGQLRLASLLWKTLSRLKPQVVLVPGYYTLPGIAAALWAKVHRRRSVLMTESTAHDHSRVWWKETVKGLLLRTLFDWALAGGASHKRYLQDLNFPMDHVMRFYDVVDNSYFLRRSCELREQGAHDTGLPEKYFLYVGRLSEEKNIGGLLSEWELYRTEGGSWPLLIVGSGPASDELRLRSSQSRFARDIHFAGHKGYRDLPLFYAFANCFILPSTREPWGLVINEAMASGLPVIVSNRCGCAEDLVTYGKNGFLFDPVIKGELAERLRQMEDLTSAELADMGQQTLQIIGRYSPEAFGEEVARISRLGVEDSQRCSRAHEWS